MVTLKRISPYVLLIFLLLGSFLLFSAWSARQAATRGSQISDINYYSKGLKYNNTRIEERAAASRGWKLTTEINNNNLRFSLSDKDGHSISHASGELTLFLSQEDRVVHLQTTEPEPGLYLLKLPDEIKGNLQARIVFEQQGVRISRQLLVNI
ncbi:FixH family protein [Geopsychrobacter electrodiphilus]|uniref:FixH family protein n=1 Tax=Geopsychrobacter electrodiphilus TaxID=225196 RepID=UPI0003818162|nr:FixH family protein [Geopsychrobacter electrodiphilus]